LSPTSKETQTKPITGVTKEIQHLPDYSEKWTNTETSLISSENTAESFIPPGIITTKVYSTWISIVQSNENDFKAVLEREDLITS